MQLGDSKTKNQFLGGLLMVWDIVIPCFEDKLNTETAKYSALGLSLRTSEHIPQVPISVSNPISCVDFTIKCILKSDVVLNFRTAYPGDGGNKSWESSSGRSSLERAVVDGQGGGQGQGMIWGLAFFSPSWKTIYWKSCHNRVLRSVLSLSFQS